MFDTKTFEARMQQAFAHFEDELKKIRTGRAHPSMLDGVQAEAYGVKMPLNQLGNVVAVEAQLLQITPFDQTSIKNIVAAIREDQALGLNPSDDGRVIRVPIPPLTTERRTQIAKQLGEKAEECRIALRNVRHEALKEAKVKKDAKEMGEDDMKRVEKNLDQLISGFQAKLEAAMKAKEIEIMTL